MAEQALSEGPQQLLPTLVTGQPAHHVLQVQEIIFRLIPGLKHPVSVTFDPLHPCNKISRGFLQDIGLDTDQVSFGDEYSPCPQCDRVGTFQHIFANPYMAGANGIVNFCVTDADMKCPIIFGGVAHSPSETSKQIKKGEPFAPLMLKKEKKSKNIPPPLDHPLTINQRRQRREKRRREIELPKLKKNAKRVMRCVSRSLNTRMLRERNVQKKSQSSVMRYHSRC